MRRCILTLLSSAALGVAFGQTAPAAREASGGSAAEPVSEEFIVRGRRLTHLRFEVELAQEQAYKIFNEINSDDDFDVSCREERKYHSRAKQRTCRAQFENRISSQAATEYMRALSWRCQAGPDGGQACMFSDIGQNAANAAQAVEGELPTKQKQMTAEIVRLANEDDRFAQAILDWYEKTQQYEAARQRRRED